MFEINSAFNNSLSKVCNTSLVKKVFKNPLYTAFLAVLIILLIIHLVADEEDDIHYIKLGSWLMLACTSIIFIYTNMLTKELQADNKYNDVMPIVGGNENILSKDDAYIPINNEFELEGFN